jgi:hypothetical protein
MNHVRYERRGKGQNIMAGTAAAVGAATRGRGEYSCGCSARKATDDPVAPASILRIHRDIIRPVHEGLARELGVPDSPATDAMSIACGFQESRFATRDQRDAANVISPATG